MVYILVLFGSFFGICVILGTRVALRNRNIRSFVRGVKKRTEKARERGLTMRETRLDKSTSNVRASAVGLQKCRVLLREAEKAMARRSYDEVQRLLIQALTVDPESIEAGAQLAQLYLRTERNGKAEALYRELLQQQEDVSFYANLGLACFKQKKFDDACHAYQEALNRDEKNPERAAALGRACMAAGHLNEAVDLLTHASERLARDTELLSLLARCHEQLSNRKEAEEVYKKIHKLQPYDTLVQEKLAELASI